MIGEGKLITLAQKNDYLAGFMLKPFKID